MTQLETLLNTLIARGWKPWGLEYTEIDIVQDGRDECLMFWNVPERQMKAYTIRNLVSLESGLWQFCEKNGLLHEYYNGRSNIHPYKCYWTTTYEYRLLEAALIPEEELGKFLVDSIKAEGTD